MLAQRGAEGLRQVALQQAKTNRSPPLVAGTWAQRDKLRALGFGDALSEFYGPDGEAALEAKFAAADYYNPDHEPAQPIDTAQSRADIGRLERAVDGAGRGLDARRDRPYRAVGLHDHENLDALARAFGVRVVGFDVPDSLLQPRYQKFDGVTFPREGSNAVFLLAGAKRPHLALLGYGFVHQAR